MEDHLRSQIYGLIIVCLGDILFVSVNFKSGAQLKIKTHWGLRSFVLAVFAEGVL